MNMLIHWHTDSIFQTSCVCPLFNCYWPVKNTEFECQNKFDPHCKLFQHQNLIWTISHNKFIYLWLLLSLLLNLYLIISYLYITIFKVRCVCVCVCVWQSKREREIDTIERQRQTPRTTKAHKDFPNPVPSIYLFIHINMSTASHG